MKLLKTLCALAAFHATQALAAWAEFGRQDVIGPAYRSNSDYSGLGSTRYVFVTHTAQGRANLATAPTSSTILGVMQNNPGIDEAMIIAYGGGSKVVAGGSITAGQLITTNGSGRAAAVASGQIACGRALESVSNDGEIFTALLFHPVRWAGAA